ncbi:hypothetical protein, partial [Alistipes putredinis]|uniref:hypothetical protein n=1 Tax=Alistipes putredinis TaxID=28117 RepID=UPI003A8A622A
IKSQSRVNKQQSRHKTKGLSSSSIFSPCSCFPSFHLLGFSDFLGQSEVAIDCLSNGVTAEYPGVLQPREKSRISILGYFHRSSGKDIFIKTTDI